MKKETKYKIKYPEAPISIANGDLEKAVKTLNEVTNWLGTVAMIEWGKLEYERGSKSKHRTQRKNVSLPSKAKSKAREGRDSNSTTY